MTSPLPGPAFIAQMPPSPETARRYWSMYCRVCGIEEMMMDTADDPRLIEHRDAHNREHQALAHEKAWRDAVTSPLPTDEDREALQRLIYTFETTDLGDNLAITTRDSYALADSILAAGFRRSVVSTPSEPHPLDALWDGTPSTARAIADAKARERLEASAASAPPTITDAAVQHVRETVFAQSQRERSTGARGSGLYYPSIDGATTILRAALGGEEQQ